jgi:hypothetical protein
MASRSRTAACSSMSSAAARFQAGVRAASVEALEAEDTPRALLLVLAVLQGLARPLDLVGLEVVADSVVDLVVEAAVAGALVEVIVAASEEGSAAVVAAVAVVLDTKDRMATARQTVLLPVLEDREVGSAAAAVATVEIVEIVEATAAVIVMAVTDVEEAIEALAVPTTNHSAETDTTTVIVAAETAMVAGTTPENERTRATATTTGASAGGTSLYRRLCRSQMGLSRLPPISPFYLVGQRG